MQSNSEREMREGVSRIHWSLQMVLDSDIHRVRLMYRYLPGEGYIRFLIGVSNDRCCCSKPRKEPQVDLGSQVRVDVIRADS